MIQIEKESFAGFQEAIRGMRNPMNSWEKSDSFHCNVNPLCSVCEENHTGRCQSGLVIADNDHKLMQKLCVSGPDHRKFMRMMVVWVDVTAPLYWWKEFDTYKVGTVANSCSTMHKIQAKKFILDDFSHEHLIGFWETPLCETIEMLNKTRELYLESHKKDKELWYRMIQLLPTSYNQKRTVMLNYEVLINMYHARKDHKLDEWRKFCEWIEKLPLSELITGNEGLKNEKAL